MSAFRYVALGADGRRHSGTLEGDSARLVRQQLRGQGLFPVTVDPVAGGDGRSRGLGGFRQRWSAKELQLFTQQLATLLKSGLPLDQALKTIANQAESSALQATVMAIRSQVTEGRSLSEALAGYPQNFDRLYRATVSAGEASGKLDAVLQGLLGHMARRRRMTQKTQAALVYPIILTLVSVLVVFGLLRFVVPEIVVVFEGTGQRLPVLTVGLIALSDFIGQWWHGLLGGLVALAVAVRLLLTRHQHSRTVWHRALLRTPVLSRFLRTVQTARLTRTLAILVGSGVPLIESLKIAGEVLSLIPYREALEDVTVRVREGESLSHALEVSGRLPPVTLSLIASGETGGNLGEMLANAADDRESEIEATTEVILSLFEPLVILLMGGAVLLIVLAMLLPIFEMNQLVG